MQYSPYRSKLDYTPRIVRVIFAQGPCSKKNTLNCAILAQEPCCIANKKPDNTSRIVRVTPVQGPHSSPCLSGKKELDCTARLLREIRTFGRAVECSSVSPLTNTMGGLSGGKRGDDTSGAHASTSFTRQRFRPFALILATGTCCPPFFIKITVMTVRLQSASEAFYSPASVSVTSRGRVVVPHSFLQPQRCTQSFLEGECDSVEAEHAAHPPFFALDLLATASPDSAAHAKTAPPTSSSPCCAPSKFHRRRQPLRRRQATEERHPCVHAWWTELFVSLCVLPRICTL